MTEIQVSINIDGQGTFAGTLYQANPVEKPQIGLLTTTVVVDGLDKPGVVEFGLPIRAGDMDANQRIVVKLGDTMLAVQEDGRATDRNKKLRMVSLAVLVTSPAAKKILTITSETGALPPRGGKTVAQLLAIKPDAQCAYQVNILGAKYTADFRAAASGSTTFKRGTAFQPAGFFHDGPLRKTFVCKMPLMSGNNAHPTIMAEFLATALSKDGFVADITWRFDPILLNGWCDTKDQTDYPMDVVITTGIANPVIVKEYHDRLFALPLTRATATSMAAGPNIFNKNDLGRVFRTLASGKRAMINGVSADGATATIINYPVATLETQAFAPGSLALHGLNLHFGGSWWEPEVWYGDQPKYLVRHERDYIFRSGIVPSHAIPSSWVNNATGGISKAGGGSFAGTNHLDKFGDNPFACLQSYIGEQYVSPNEDDARPIPYYQINALRKMEGDVGPYIDASSYRRLYETPRLFSNHNPWNILDDNTGLLLNPATPGREGFVEDDIPARQVGRLYGYEEASCNHTESDFFVPYALTGRLRWLRAMHENAMRTFMVKGSLDASDGINRPLFRDGAPRGAWWAWRVVAHAAALTPDDMPATITGLDQAVLRQWEANNAKQTKARLVDDGSGHTGWSQEKPYPGPDFHTPGDPFYTPTGFGKPGGLCVTLGFMDSYGGMLYPHLDDLGILTLDGKAVFEQCVAGIVESVAGPASVDGFDPVKTFGIYHGPEISLNTAAGVFPGWPALYPLLAAAPAVQPGYKAFQHQVLTCALDRGYYDPVRTRKALDNANAIIDKEDVGSISNGAFVPLFNSNVQYVQHWMAPKPAP